MSISPIIPLLGFMTLTPLPILLETFMSWTTTRRFLQRTFTFRRPCNLSVFFINSILLLLRSIQETLQDISLHLNVCKSRELETRIFAKFKCLTVTKDYDQQRILDSFLVNYLTSLEELDIALCEYMNDITTIATCCNDLKKFHLKTKQNDYVYIDWSFLGGMKSPNDFHVCWPYTRCGFHKLDYGCGLRFLESLPRSQLQRLSLKGITDMGLFWTTKIDNNLIVHPDLQFKSSEASIISSIQRKFR